MREILLYGALGRKFGRRFQFDVRSPAEAIAALKANLDGFTEYLIQYSKPGYRVFVGERNIGQQELTLHGKPETIKIIPVVAGMGGKGVFQTIFGIILVVVGAWTSNPALVSAGLSMVIGGITQMLTRSPERKQREEGQSYSFNGPVNTSDQGNPVAVAYGTLIVGSQVISAGLSVDQQLAGGTASPPTAFPPGFIPSWVE